VKNMGKLMKQAQQLQQKMQEIQEELKTRTVEGSAGGGMVTVTATCAQEIRGVKINKEVVDANDVEMLEDLVAAAVNEALRKGQEEAAAAMGGLTGGLNIPGLM